MSHGWKSYNAFVALSSFVCFLFQKYCCSLILLFVYLVVSTLYAKVYTTHIIKTSENGENLYNNSLFIFIVYP
jgi:heme exporter protein D